jgi:hypothetical protein
MKANRVNPLAELALLKQWKDLRKRMIAARQILASWEHPRLFPSHRCVFQGLALQGRAWMARR